MPYYVYECDKCETRFDEFHGMKEDPKFKCPSCNSKKVRKLITGGAGVLFKGSGFHGTDYRKDT